VKLRPSLVDAAKLADSAAEIARGLRCRPSCVRGLGGGKNAIAGDPVPPNRDRTAPGIGRLLLPVLRAKEVREYLSVAKKGVLVYVLCFAGASGPSVMALAMAQRLQQKWISEAMQSDKVLAEVVPPSPANNQGSMSRWPARPMPPVPAIRAALLRRPLALVAVDCARDETLARKHNFAQLYPVWLAYFDNKLVSISQHLVRPGQDSMDEKVLEQSMKESQLKARAGLRLAEDFAFA
jgi:hypothetical protein